MNKYLIFRTDRVGDFLVSIILITSIKRNDPTSHITVVTSDKNYDYVNSFKSVDSTILLKKGIFSKIKLFLLLNKNFYHSIIISDKKNRSKIFSFFLKSNIKIFLKKNKDIPKIDEIKEILKKLSFDFNNLDLNTLSGRNYKNSKLNNYILIHFDEKWVHDEYILNYIKIEPGINDFEDFLNLLCIKFKKKIIISTGIKTPFLLTNFFKYNNNYNIKLIEKSTLFELETIIRNASLLISCHGSVSHIAAASNIPQIDIIDKSYDYAKWTNHFRNYKFVYRKSFVLLTKDIINLI